MRMMRTIYYNLGKIFQIAKRDGIPTYKAADRMAEERINQIGKDQAAAHGQPPDPFHSGACAGSIRPRRDAGARRLALPAARCTAVAGDASADTVQAAGEGHVFAPAPHLHLAPADATAAATTDTGPVPAADSNPAR